MKKKTAKKVWKSALSLIGIITLAVIAISLYSIVSNYIREDPQMFLMWGLGVAAFLILIGALSFKKVRNKIIDIFT